MFHNTYTKSFVVTIVLMPVIVQMVIMLVNGNVGTGVAVMGAFSLVRFRSVAGSAREIAAIFLSMALGIATGMGYLGMAAIAIVVIGLTQILLVLTPFGEKGGGTKELKITIPESLDYSGIFDDLFEKYAKKIELVQVKTTNMGSLFELRYHVNLRDKTQEKAFIDDLRCRNGNLNISCGRIPESREQL
jgi:ABC-type transport system involved in multi-copper enzyme maturation permease subunit